VDAAAGGLVSHGDVRMEQMIRLGDLAGRALKGQKPEAIAVARAEKFETVINAKTAAALGIELPATLREGAQIVQ
jgi:putative ABC transport system substrate-binding protein